MTRAALIADDERLARLELRRLLTEAHADSIRIVAEADSLRSAREQARLQDVDVIFLDVQMGRESGLDLVPDLAPGIDIVFVTAYDQYAVRAFELNAIDYLLKPIAPDRLARTVERLVAPAPALPGELPAGPLRIEDRLFLRVADRMRFVKVSDIACLTADGDYTILDVGGAGTVRVRRALREWEARLPRSAFTRIHRSTIINLDRVARVEEWSHGSYQIRLTDRTKPVLMSRRFATRVKGRLI